MTAFILSLTGVALVGASFMATLLTWRRRPQPIGPSLVNMLGIVLTGISCVMNRNPWLASVDAVLTVVLIALVVLIKRSNRRNARLS